MGNACKFKTLYKTTTKNPTMKAGHKYANSMWLDVIKNTSIVWHSKISFGSIFLILKGNILMIYWGVISQGSCDITVIHHCICCTVVQSCKYFIVTWTNLNNSTDKTAHYQSPNFYSFTVEVWEWISNSITLYRSGDMMDIITYTNTLHLLWEDWPWVDIPHKGPTMWKVFLCHHNLMIHLGYSPCLHQLNTFLLRWMSFQVISLDLWQIMTRIQLSL